MLKADDPRTFFLSSLALTLVAAACSATGPSTSNPTSASGTGGGTTGTGGKGGWAASANIRASIRRKPRRNM